jgi:hypothetical protein
MDILLELACGFELLSKTAAKLHYKAAPGQAINPDSSNLPANCRNARISTKLPCDLQGGLENCGANSTINGARLPVVASCSRKESSSTTFHPAQGVT